VGLVLEAARARRRRDGLRKQQFSACCEKEKEVILVIATQPQPIRHPAVPTHAAIPIDSGIRTAHRVRNTRVCV
jgi:hypothetical protein